MLMDMARVTAQRGTCDRLQVGAVVSIRGRIISTGYNGVASGLPHCDHSNDIPLQVTYDHPVQIDDIRWDITPGHIMETPRDSQFSVGCTRAVHAEQNAVASAARYGSALDGADLHCTHAPCVSCANSIINAGIVRVIYDIPYRIVDGVELLAQAGLEVIDFSSLVKVV